MSDSVTKQDLNELTATILDAVNSMYKSLTDRISENAERPAAQIKTIIENGVEKKIDLLAEKLDAIEKKQSAMEEHLGRLTEDVQEVKLRLAEHDEEIITLRRVK